jgi:F420-dependent oxidoreductase-like protein
MLRSAKIAPVFDYALIERFWRDADELGFHGVWNYDHFYGLIDHAGPTLEGWTTLAAMAALTSRARVGCMVTGVTYRHPAVLAKMAVAVDHISGGRLEFGLGAAWHQAEHEGFGIDFPSAGTRIAMLDEACTLIRRMWSEDEVDHSGRFWKLDRARCNPKPVQGRIPMIIGGSGERKTLRVVAKHADEWNFPAAGAGPKEFARLQGVLDDHCAAVGRDPTRIRRSVQLFITPSNQEQTRSQLDSLGDWEDAGAQHIVFSFYSPPSRELLQSLAPR